MKHLNFKRAGFLALILASMGSVSHAQNDVRIRINGEPFRTEIAPVVQNGRVLVPMRAIFERLGARVNFNRADRSIVATRRGTEVQMTLGRRRALVNGDVVRLEVAPQATGGRTLVPLRFVSESLGASVNFDSTRQVVRIEEGATVGRERDRDQDGVRNRDDVFPDNPRR